MNKKTKELLAFLAGQYEKKDFLEGDPSWFMHQYNDFHDQEVIAFIAAQLSYGSRKVFMEKIRKITLLMDGKPYLWVKEGIFRNDIPDDNKCFYRLYTHHDLRVFLQLLQSILCRYDSLRGCLFPCHTAIDALKNITILFKSSKMIPNNTTSCCKRLCMFLRWMVRDNLPVDLGLWTDFMDKKTLIIPLDTHVVQQSIRLGLINTKSASMHNAQKLTKELLKVFPDDPLKGDFALFGYGIEHD